MQDYCDWCFGTLTDRDRREPFNELLNQVEAYACSVCIRGGRVLKPPESLESPPDAWEAATVAVYDGDPQALAMLRRAAGFDASASLIVTSTYHYIPKRWRTPKDDSFRAGAFKIYLDGKKRGFVRALGSRSFQLEPGRHTLRLRLRWFTSPLVTFSTEADQTVRYAATIEQSLRSFVRLLFHPLRSIQVVRDEA